MKKESGKRFKKVSEQVKTALGERRFVPLEEAVKLVKASASAKFDESFDVVARLGIDASQSDQNVRGTVSLPHGTGKSVRLIVFCQGEKQKEAQAAGADAVGAADLVEKVQGGWTDFDLAIATPDMMKDVGKLGKVLGPKGLMPNPKSGTVTMDLAKAIKEFKAGKVEYRNDKSGNVHLSVGKVSFAEQALTENVRTVIAAILRSKPAASKGTFLKGVVLSSTMGPGVRVDVATIRETGR